MGYIRQTYSDLDNTKGHVVEVATTALFNGHKRVPRIQQHTIDGLDLNQTKALSIADVSQQNDGIQQNTFYSLLHYLFLSHYYNIYRIERTGPTDPEKINKILKDNQECIRRTSGNCQNLWQTKKTN